VSTAWWLNGLPGDASNTAARGALGAAVRPGRRQGRFMSRLLAVG
jgi:hypothetical protein